jgi:hypothetical protein
MTSTSATLFVGAVSFEERSIVGPRRFLRNMAAADEVCLARFGGESQQLQESLLRFREVGLTEVAEVDRFSSRALWDWVWKCVRHATGDVVIDATCLPREVLGMLLFALSVKREHIGQVRVVYVSAPPSPGGYATQNAGLKEADRWLSQGVATIRSILGYPGDFASEKRRHVVALAGHELERLVEIVSFLEPTRLSISNEQDNTSTANGAAEFSKWVASELRRRIALPEFGTVGFSANSIEETFKSLHDVSLDFAIENVVLVAMNTKLSFIGAALFALHERRVRMVYAVPESYNPLYCTGIGELGEFDITTVVKSANTTPVRSNQ